MIWGRIRRKALPDGVYIVRKGEGTIHVEKAELLAWYEDFVPPLRANGYSTHAELRFEEEHDSEVARGRRKTAEHTCGADCRRVPLYGVRRGAAPTPEAADDEDQGADVPEKPTEDSAEASRGQ